MTDSYIGVPPQSGFISQEANQYFTGLTQNYIDLNQSISSLSSVIVLVNGVVQENSDLTLTSSTRITLGATLVSADKVTCIYVAKISSTQAPATGSVTSDMLSGSIADAKITGLSSSKLSGVVPTANLGSGTASSSTVLFGDQTFKTAPSGAMTLIARNSGSSAIGNIGLDNIFSDTYDYYKIYAWINAQDDEGELRFRWRKAGSDRTDSFYINTGFASQKSSSASSSYTAFQQWNADHFVFLNNLNENDNMGATLELTIYDPRARDEGNLATIQYHGSHYRDDNLWVNINGGAMYGNQGSGDDFDGFKIYISNSDILYYDYAIYGMNKT